MTYADFAVSVACNIVGAVLGLYLLNITRNYFAKDGKAKAVDTKLQRPSGQTVRLIEKLKAALPNDILLLPVAATHATSKGHWAQQECERVPACVVQPRNAHHLSQAIDVLATEHRAQASTRETEELFAIRGGGHSAVTGAASTNGGILIDLGKLKQVQVSPDKTTVSVGAGCRWRDVSLYLDELGLAAVGGRNSDVGVGGLTLGGGVSFFSPRFGMVCSNVDEYEVVLADATVTTASRNHNADLWRALKGGANNFGIVTRFTIHCIPSSKVWSGFIYTIAWRPERLLTAFHEAVTKADPALPTHDQYAAGPIMSFSYVQGMPIQVAAINLAYTNTTESRHKWPTYWAATSFAKMWRVWSTFAVRSLTDATDEFNALNPVGKRQAMASTTILNDSSTLTAVHQAHLQAIKAVKHVKGISWTLVLQPFMPEWARKGHPNILGLDEGTAEPLVNVSFTINWSEPIYDSLVKAQVRKTTEEIEAYAEKHGTAHRFRYLNYCDNWQNPFRGYGEQNHEFLKMTSKKYDPEGLFQTGCKGGFKLWSKQD